MLWANGIARHLFRALFYAVMSYGFVYFTYKYFVPNYGGIDYSKYYNMYLHPFRFDVAGAPFVYRQLNALLVHLVWKLGIYHHDEIAFVSKSYDQRIFFAAIFANWVALVACATAVAATTRKLAPNRGEAWPLFGGALCFFNFFTQPGVLAAQSEGVSWLLVAVGFLGWERRSLAVVAAVLGLSVIQRETIPIVFGALSVFTMIFRRDQWRFHLAVLAVSLVAFLAYVVMRQVWAPAGGFEQQLRPTNFIHLLGQWGRLATLEGLFQVVLSQNLLIALGAVTVLAIFTRSDRATPRRWAIHSPTISLFLTAIALTILGVGALDPINGLGRVLSILTPIAAPLLVRALAHLFPPPSVSAVASRAADVTP
jgi:hypothetical protein